MKTLIANGTVVTSDAEHTADLLIERERIIAVGPDLPREGARVLDASGKYVLPGGVDAHTHITLDIDAARGTDVFYTGTIPAGAGGATCIVDHMAFAPQGRGLREQTALYLECSGGRPVVDYGFHGVVQRLDADTLAELALLPDQGISSVKTYMTYDDRLDDGQLLALLRRTRELGLLLTVHAENHEEITRLRARFKAEGKLEPAWHPRSRPAACEAEAVGRLLRLAAQASDAPVYVVHLSTAAGLEEIKRARAGGQSNIFAETCTQYLTLTDSLYDDPEKGLRYIMSPPLRAQSDVDALWRGVQDGDIQTIATDHCSFTLADKQKGRGDFTRCPGGAPGLEERFAVIFSEGVMRGRISVRRFTELVSTAPARLFGLYPKKGALIPGADADLVILDPAARTVLRAENLHGPSDYSLYEGMPLQGRIDAVFLRGALVAEHNEFLGKRGAGQFLKRGRMSPE